MIENVWEFTKWTAVDPATGRPVKERAKASISISWMDDHSAASDLNPNGAS
jgi:hypothetical protein